MSRVVILKFGSVIDSVSVFGHWVNGQTIKLLVEPYERIGLNRLTRLCYSIFIMKISYYIVWFCSLKKIITLIKSQKI